MVTPSKKVHQVRSQSKDCKAR